MRTTPKAPPPVSARPDPEIITQTRQYELITPLFGGGVEPATADPVTIIRGASVRGQLRFWWRACRGGQFNGDLGAMKEAEDVLWGAASTENRPRPSQVQIHVEILQPGKPFVVKTAKGEINVGHPSSPYGYVAFPLIDKPGHTVREGVKFALKISYPRALPKEFKELQLDVPAEVEAALWAWETFGGVGARTRRGFGALCCRAIDGVEVKLPRADNVKAAIEAGLKRHVAVGEWPKDVPHLQTQWTVTSAHANSLEAWKTLIASLKAFRQSRNPGVEPKQPGRSRWPEPDAIRRLTKRAAPAHKQPLSTIDKFPRGCFGLPIIFHFKDAEQGDPEDTTLQGAQYDRLASPLILRPILCAGNQAVGLALVLEAPRVPPGGLILKDAPGDPKVVSELESKEAKQIQPLKGQTDILRAFLDTL